MKAKLFFVFMLLFVMNSLMLAQSDYETLQNFKRQYKQIEESVKSAFSLDECANIEMSINRLRSDFIMNKAFLDKALYPENFESAFVKIKNMLQFKKTDLTRINLLSTQVVTLQNHVQDLNQKNEELIKQINELRTKSEKDESTIAELKRLVAQLRGNIDQRDLLVRDLVDSLLAEFNKLPQNISPKEAQSIISKVNKGNLFNNIERAISDNIQFTKVTEMTADDFARMKNQHRDFEIIWKQIGPRLSSVYLNEQQQKSKISQIDSLFVQWNNEINNEIWRSIHNLFLENDINLIPFDNSISFVNSVSFFIEEEINNYGIKNENESKDNFNTFTEVVYYNTVEKEWLPLLIEYNLMELEEKDIIDVKIKTWRETIEPSDSYWIYIVIIAIILLPIVYLVYKRNARYIKIE